MKFLLLIASLFFNNVKAEEKRTWPNKAQLVISISMQFEAGGQPSGAESPFPPIKLKEGEVDYPSLSWFQYGYKEGISRMLNLWDKHNIKVTSHIVGSAAQKNPAIAKMIADKGHETASHGMTWKPLQGLSFKEENKQIAESVSTIESITGQKPVGWNAFWMRGTSNTLKILKRNGFLYTIDDLSRDEPFIIKVEGEKFVVIPYTIRNNDISLIEGKNYSADQFLTQLKMEFDQLYEEGINNRRMMSISLHDRIGGTPSIVKAMDEFIRYAKSKKRVEFMRKVDIAKMVMDDPQTIIEE